MILNIDRLNTIRHILVFFLGFFSCVFLFYNLIFIGVEVPFGATYSNNVEAPSNWVSREEIVVLDNQVIIQVSDVRLSSYAPTGSMKPVFDEGANGIRIKPKSPDSIQEGDIVSFRTDYGLIVHRVIEKGVDNRGEYFITKGDNSNVNDGKIRFEDIEYVTIGVIW